MNFCAAHWRTCGVNVRPRPSSFWSSLLTLNFEGFAWVWIWKVRSEEPIAAEKMSFHWCGTYIMRPGYLWAVYSLFRIIGFFSYIFSRQTMLQACSGVRSLSNNFPKTWNIPTIGYNHAWVEFPYIYCEPNFTDAVKISQKVHFIHRYRRHNLRCLV